MTVTVGHFRLTPDQRRFSEMLSAYPRLLGFWDFETRECDLAGLEQEMNKLSHGEALMARFLAGVWLGEDRLSFDLIDASKTLDSSHRRVIADWLADPYHP